MACSKGISNELIFRYLYSVLNMKRNRFLKNMLGLGLLSVWACQPDEKNKTAIAFAGYTILIWTASLCFGKAYHSP